MAEILITGIEMPKDGDVLFLAITSGGVVGRSEKALHYIPQNAKAQELPPHGDLIDRQKLLEHRFEVYDGDEEVCEDYIETYHVIEAPAIIEASKEKI